jgi:hypothetical protein
MLLRWAPKLAVVLVCLSAVVNAEGIDLRQKLPEGKKQADVLAQWVNVPPSDGGLVIIIDAKILGIEISDPEGVKFDARKWQPGIPYIKQFRVTPGRYQLRLSEPFVSVDVVTKPGSLTYVQFSPYFRGRVRGGRITSWIDNTAPAQVAQFLLGASKEVGLAEALTTTHIAPAGNILYVSTEPPWSIPPPPPPR